MLDAGENLQDDKKEEKEEEDLCVFSYPRAHPLFSEASRTPLKEEAMIPEIS